MEFLLQPYVYSTGGTMTLLNLLDNMWLKTHQDGEGTIFIVSGFANYNGGVRFYPRFTKHVHDGGRIQVIVCVKQAVYENEPWMMPLEIAGIYALSNNAGHREKRKAPVSLDDPSLANNIRFSIPPEHVLRDEAEDEQNRKEKKDSQIASEYEKLLPRQKKIIHMVCLGKKRHQEAAELLGIDRSGVTHSLSGIKKRFEKFI